MSSHCTENSTNFDNCCNGITPSRNIEKSHLAVVPGSKKCCTSKAATGCLDASSTCSNSSKSADVSEYKATPDSCCKNVSNGTGIPQQVDGSLFMQEHPCGNTKTKCNKSKKTAEKQAEKSSCSKSRDASFPLEPKRGCCSKNSDSCREEIEQSETSPSSESEKGPSSEENFSKHGSNSCCGSGEVVCPSEKYNSNNGIAKSQMPSCKSSCLDDSDSLKNTKKQCCDKIDVDTNCFTKSDCVSKYLPNREEKEKAVISSCSDYKISSGNLSPETCEIVIQGEEEADSDSCTALCDDINGHHSTCTNVRKSFTINTSTMLLGIPNEPTEEESSREDAALLPQKCTTKLRIQNICCAMEANLVRECLEPMESVFSVAVNVIGRVAHVRHNPQITSPTDLVNCLNQVHLGASIMESGSHGDSDKNKKIPSSLKLYFLYLLIQTVLFVTAVIGFAIKENWYQWVAIAEIVFGILPVIKKAFISLKKCTVDISVLMFIAVVGTIAIKEWIEGATVVFVFAVAEGLQDLCMYKVQRTISSLMLKAPQVAVIAKSGECVPVENVAIGTVIAVRPGELVALDGVVVSGRAAIDESSISGEAVPVEKSVDSVVFSGTVNQNGYIEVRTTSDSSSSTVSKVSQMVEEAQASSATTEILLNRFAKFYTPIVIAVSALIVIFPAILGASGVGTYLEDISEWGRRALVMLVIACPCALVMSTPIAIVCGITAAARKGALVKGGVFMETLARLKFLAFDKTGTLTEGKFQVVDIECEFGLNERETLRMAAALESKSSHPLAAAIVNEFSGCVSEMVKSQGTELLPEVTNFALHEGRGVSGVVEGQIVKIGNFEFVSSNGNVLSKHMEAKYHQWSEDSKTVVFVCVGSKLAMMIALADSIRPNTTLTLNWLKHLGVQTSMITGDNSRTAAAVRNKLGLDQFVSEMKPKDKLLWIQNKQQNKTETTGLLRYNENDMESGCLKRRKHPRQRIVGMVGDGINDGPALAAANVGIAMGAGGTALAVEAADVALMSNNLAKIPELVSLGRFCRRVVIQNICFSILLKLAVVTAALLGKAALWMAVCADVLGLLFVILNGLRPLWWKSSRLKNKEDASIQLAFAKAERVRYMYETSV